MNDIIRPIIPHPTVARLFKLDWALDAIESLRAANQNVLKPKFVRLAASPSWTEGQVYTVNVLRLICDVSFGAVNKNPYPARKQIFCANVSWAKHHVLMGKGLDYAELASFARLYAQHVSEDTGLPCG